MDQFFLRQYNLANVELTFVIQLSLKPQGDDVREVKAKLREVRGIKAKLGEVSGEREAISKGTSARRAAGG